MTTPLTPADCDLRDFPRMMVDVARLMGSQFNATASRNPVAWMIGHKLWYRAWHQVPAASLPNDDEQLCHLAELGFDMKTWKKAKDIALRGWVHCDDGRIYHPMVAEVALEAWIEKLLQRLSSGAGNAKRYGHTFDPSSLNASIDVAAGLLEVLNPRSKATDKLKRRQSRTAPEHLPPGGQKAPTGSATGVPPGSQETGTGTGRLIEEGSNDPSLSGGKPRRASGSPQKSPVEPLPAGYPDAAAVAEAVAWIAAAGVAVDAAAQARRFVNYAATKERHERNWPAAWRGWIEIEIQRAPAAKTVAPASQAPIVWNGPDAVWAACVAAMGEPLTRSYLGRCTWQEVPSPAVIAPSPFVRDKLATARLSVEIQTRKEVA